MMNSKIYGKLAVTNLKNNKKSYIPYILASAFLDMMYFIMDNLYRNRSLVEKGSPACDYVVLCSSGNSHFFDYLFVLYQ